MRFLISIFPTVNGESKIPLSIRSALCLAIERSKSEAADYARMRLGNGEQLKGTVDCESPKNISISRSGRMDDNARAGRSRHGR
jgi:hypothetical protein